MVGPRLMAKRKRKPAKPRRIVLYLKPNAQAAVKAWKAKHLPHGKFAHAVLRMALTAYIAERDREALLRTLLRDETALRMKWACETEDS